MDRRQLLFGMTALALGSSKLSSLLQAQISETAGWLPETSSNRVSDREKRGLRGPVKACISDESLTTEYDLNGNILSDRGTDSRGKWGGTWAYDGDGRLLKYTWSGSDGSTTEQIYSYDETGRLLSITDSSGDRTHFRYDEQGRKMSVQSFAPKPPEEGLTGATGVDSVSGSVFRLAQSGFGVPEGGSVTTLYNESDQATEVQIRDDKGSVVSRVIRTYGANGQPSEEKAILENLAPMFLNTFPTEVRAELGPAQIRAMNKGLITLMGGGGGTSYTYDAQNRIRERHERNMHIETVTTIAYNDHGDIVEERRIWIRDSTVPKGGPFSIDENGNLIPTQEASEAPAPPEPLPAPSEVRYDYQYDSYGNWTEISQLSRSSPDEPFHGTFSSRRKFTYY